MRLGLISGIGIGAGMMYLLDPSAGQRRRNELRERAGDTIDRTGEAIGKASHAIREGAQGVMERAGISGDSGRPGQSQAQAMIRRVKDQADDVGERVTSIVRENPDAMRRLLTGAAGGALTYYGFSRRSVVGAGLGSVGVVMVAYGVTGKSPRQLLSRGAPQGQGFDVQKAVKVEAPIERVYEFWTRYDNFNRFFSHIEKVEDLGNGRSRWVAKGPAGMPVEWEAMLTARVANEKIAWRSSPESEFQTSGEVQFRRSGQGTEIDVRMHYVPPAGALGEKVAKILGADPQRALDEDMNKLRSLLDQGSSGGGAAQMAGATAGSSASSRTAGSGSQTFGQGMGTNPQHGNAGSKPGGQTSGAHQGDAGSGSQQSSQSQTGQGSVNQQTGGGSSSSQGSGSKPTGPSHQTTQGSSPQSAGASTSQSGSPTQGGAGSSQGGQGNRAGSNTQGTNQQQDRNRPQQR